MKPLNHFIFENTLHNNEVILDIVDTNISNVDKKIVEGYESAFTKLKILRVETFTAEDDARIADNKRIDKEKALAIMQSKPGLMKRSPEKQEEWVNKKMEELAKENSWRYARRIVDIPKSFLVGVHTDIHHDHGYETIKTEYADPIKGLTDIANELKKKSRYDTCWEYLKQICYSTSSYGSIHIHFIFDAMTEEQLTQEQKAFSDFMCREYANSKYTGD